MSLSELSADVRRSRRILDQQVGEVKSLAVRGKSLEKEIGSLTGTIEVLDRVSGILNKIGEERQDTAQRQIEGLVTRGLQVIFGNELSFHVVSSVKAKAAHTDFVVRTQLLDGTIIDTPVLEARGGGLSSVVGFLLRIVELLLSKSRQQQILILDETFAAVSAEYEPRLAEFIREIVDKTTIQIILVTHSTAFNDLADVVYKFSLDDGQTKVKKL